MRVIEHGNTHKEIRCSDCGCLFEYDKTDIKVQLTPPFFGYDCSYAYIVCPECKKNITEF